MLRTSWEPGSLPLDNPYGIECPPCLLLAASYLFLTLFHLQGGESYPISQVRKQGPRAAKYLAQNLTVESGILGIQNSCLQIQNQSSFLLSELLLLK